MKDGWATLAETEKGGHGESHDPALRREEQGYGPNEIILNAWHRLSDKGYSNQHLQRLCQFFLAQDEEGVVDWSKWTEDQKNPNWSYHNYLDNLGI